MFFSMQDLILDPRYDAYSVFLAINLNYIENGFKAIHYAAMHNPELLRIIVNHCLEINNKLSLAYLETKTKEKQTPLHFACMFNDESVKILVDAGVNLDCLDKHCNTPLHYASERSAVAVKILLENKANFELENNDGHTAFTIAITDNHEAVEHFLDYVNVETVDILGYRPIHYAAENNYISLRWLIDYGADLEKKTYDGETPIMLAFRENNIDNIRYLINRTNLNVINIYGNSLIAYTNHHPESIKLLINHPNFDIKSVKDKLSDY